MSATARRLVLAGLGVVVAIGAAVVFVGPTVLATGSLAAEFTIALYAGLAFYWALGVVIVVRADGHLVGWLFALSAAMLAAAFGCWAASAAASTVDPGGAIAGWFTLAGALLFTPALVLAVPAVTIVFPTGAIPGPRWRGPVTVLVALVASATLGILLHPDIEEGQPIHPLTAWTADLPPIAIELLAFMGDIGALAVPYGFALGVTAVIVRFRRSQDVERAQLKWLVAAAIPAAILIPLSLSDLGQAIPAIDVISVLTLPLPALAVTVAILRHRLFDIDRIISRSIGYGLITGLLVAVYAGLILLLQGPLDSVTGGSTLAVAITTLIVAALFQPVRRRVQRAVDRRFDRSRYDSVRTAEAFARDVRREVDLSRLREMLAGTADDAVRPSATSVWLRRRASGARR